MAGRRFLGYYPKLTGRPWNQVAPEFEDWLRRLTQSVTNGVPGGFQDLVPIGITIGATGDAGDENDGWAAARHVHPVGTPGVPANLGDAASAGSSTTPARSDHVHLRDDQGELMAWLGL